MKSRLHAALTILTFAASAAAYNVARGEVYAVLDSNGVFAGTRIVPGRGVNASGAWEITGDAASRSYVLNPEGAARGDSRPEIAVSPATGLPLAVWSRRDGANYDIASSSFDGHAWSAPARIHLPNTTDDLDPRIIFRADGVAIVTWWQNSPTPVVRMAYATASSAGHWLDAGVISTPGVKAKRPAIRQVGNLTIIAYRTPRDIGIVSLTIASSTGLGDGPTPFPRSGDQDGGPGSDGPAPTGN